jgi:hypothetical protein
MGIKNFVILFMTLMSLSNCQLNRHIGCLSEYKGEQVELLKYIGKGQYIVRPYLDTTKTFIIDSKYLD